MPAAAMVSLVTESAEARGRAVSYLTLAQVLAVCQNSEGQLAECSLVAGHKARRCSSEALGPTALYQASGMCGECSSVERCLLTSRPRGSSRLVCCCRCPLNHVGRSWSHTLQNPVRSRCQNPFCGLPSGTTGQAATKVTQWEAGPGRPRDLSLDRCLLQYEALTDDPGAAEQGVERSMEVALPGRWERNCGCSDTGA